MKHQIPKTDSIEELARFWSSHDVTDFPDELQEVSAPVFKRSEVIRLALTATEHDVLRQLAATRGEQESVLVHEWVKEKLHQS